MDAIDTLLTRGVDSVYPSREALEKVLRSGKKLTLYQGFDPTGTQLHVGHAVAIRKLRQFQDLGHHVIFLIGDGTGQAGDPSGKMKARGRFMSREELRANARDYVKQAGKIVRFDGENPVEIRYNGDWLNELKLVDILDIAQHFSVQQLIERDMYQERMKKNESINLREFLYPLLQGYDSVAMGVDLEMGGTDQTFNMLAGRQLVGSMLGKEKFVMTVPLLTDSRGVKIGKTEGNVIGLTDAPADFYAKVMSLGDDAIVPCLTLLTDLDAGKIAEIKTDMAGGANPMTYKKLLAHTLTAWLNDAAAANAAQAEFEQVHQLGNSTSASANDVSVPKAEWENPAELLVAIGAVPSKSKARQLVADRAVDVDGEVVPMSKLTIADGAIIKVGKKIILRAKLV
jgi:tyrosyl-tRNA synthetase